MPPPVLAGRDALRERVRIAIARLRLGRSAKSVLMVGLRGVGKTVLLEQMRLDAEGEGVHTLCIDDPEHRSLPAVLAPQLRLVLLRLSRIDAAKDTAQRALSALAGFATALEGRFNDREVDLDFDAEAAGLADHCQGEGDLTTLLEQTGLAAQLADSALVLFIDEFHCIEKSQLSALIMVLHRCVQARLPVTVVGAGLPQLRGRVGNAKPYAERLFDFAEIGALSEGEATHAIVQPAEAEGVAYEAEAVRLIVAKTGGYPYFLQAWASHAWDEAAASPITVVDVNKAASEVSAALDERFFRVRLHRLTPMEKKYLRAMADLGPGPHRSDEIAERQGRRVQAVAPVRHSLIAKGMIWSPGRGDAAFTVPFFDEFLKRIAPGDDGNGVS
ncbi:ATP-binding protein [Pseudomonas sp. PDM31]|uniref:ATP-binding protein n=1 Tax=Pseudomonas sp. PDM31 TaxID=2854778 RepID=UPI00210D8017|nr:ATP-binding protein [Pseudomonas sp. PDM31]